MNFELGNIIRLAIRSTVLAIIVFGTVTLIPQREIELKNKLLVSLVVVILYILVDFVGGGLGSVGRFMCRMTCGCNSGDDLDTSEVDLSI